VKLTKYHPPIRRLQEDFARRLALKRMSDRLGPRPPSTITDNSVPWMEHPDSVSDLWFIASQVNERVEAWKRQQIPSSVN
jgi:hypothetical protein